MEAVRQCLIRYRFSWVELLGIMCALRALDAGQVWSALGIVAAFALSQAWLESWRP